MRHFILTGSPVAVRSGGYAATYRELGREFLVSLIGSVAGRGERVREAVFSLPHGAPARYREWVASVAEETGIPEYFFIDEITAATIGYGVPLETDRAVMLIDFGSENLAVTVAYPGQLSAGEDLDSHVIASAIADTGGQDIDRWIADDLLVRCSGGVHPGTRTRPDGLVAACKTVKEKLSVCDNATVQARDRISGKTIRATLTRKDLEAILCRQDLYETLDRTITRACDLAQARGYEPGRIQYVLLTGGGCLIPSIMDAVVTRFGREKIRCDSPRSAIAVGAALYRAGAGSSRSLARDYALRYWDAGTSRHEYRYVVRRGTAYPTKQDTARVLISAAYDGQTHLGLALYAFGDGRTDNGSLDIELVTDPAGKTCCIEQSGDMQTDRATWINEADPTILIANPPGQKGEVRFELVFTIDSRGILRLTARDVKTGSIILENHSCAKLT